MTYEEIRASLQISNAQMIAVLKEYFPKFSKVQASMICNPAYGIQLSDDAVAYLTGNITPPKQGARRGRSVVNDEMVRFMYASKAQGYNNRQIAAALGVHYKTVEYHLRKRKRSDLPPLVYTGKWGYDDDQT